MNYTFHILKLRKIGHIGNLLNLFKSYLSNRYQHVKINGYLSSKFCVKSGVPQSEHFSSWLFLLFLFDVGSCFESYQFKILANDRKLYHAIVSERDCIILQEDFNRSSKLM